jgi:site-specific DNA recombinase
VRFAFEGRCSTEDQQDPESSRGWQLTRAKSLIEPHGGVVVAEYFDSGQSRAVPWQRRPKAAALLEDLRNPSRGFDAVVIGEPQRAFYGNQFGLVFPLFAHYGVPLWVPEVGGPIDPNNEAHDLIMSVFGGMSKGERNRIKVRVRSAMAAQTQLEGRFLGGRPPYGYRLIDLGPHPNPAKAADGRRLHGLAICDETAPVVRRIYIEFLAGKGMFAIAEGLTRDGIPSPSAHDPARNRHRCGVAWAKSAVRAILTNPRYTGRQVWNRQRKDEVLLDVEDVALGHVTKLRWNPAENWIRSEQVVHPPIIDQDTFDMTQRLLAGRGRTTERTRLRVPRTYVLRGCLYCGVCERKMQGQWSHETAYYRCRFPNEYALANKIPHPRNVYLREADVLSPLDRWLSQVLAPSRIQHTVEQMTASQEAYDHSSAAERARATIADCTTKLARYRAALDAGADPSVVTGWIADTQAEQIKAQAELRRRTGTVRMTREEIRAIVDSLASLRTVLRDAAPADKAEIYRHLDLRLTFQPATHIVTAEANLDPDPRGVKERVRGGTRTRFCGTPAHSGCSCVLRYQSWVIICQAAGGWWMVDGGWWRGLS